MRASPLDPRFPASAAPGEVASRRQARRVGPFSIAQSAELLHADKAKTKITDCLAEDLSRASMIFTLDDVIGLREGRYRERQVGELPGEDLIRLGWRSPIVYLSSASLQHINERHPDVTDFDLLQLPLMIRKGLLIRENAKPNVLLACYQASEKRYCAVLKMAASTSFDIWVDSVRRMRPRQTRAMLARGVMIRPHQN